MSDDKAPGTFAPATAATLDPNVSLPRDEVKPDTSATKAEDSKPKRPTTRAGRRAAAEARKAEQAAKGDKAPKASKPSPRKATLETRLTDSLTSLGMIVTASGAMVSPAVQADGVTIIEHSANVAKALAKVADNDPKVKAALERMLTAGTWSGLIGAVLPMALGIAANHNAIPASIVQLLGGQAADDDAPAAPAAPSWGGIG